MFLSFSLLLFVYAILPKMTPTSTFLITCLLLSRFEDIRQKKISLRLEVTTFKVFKSKWNVKQNTMLKRESYPNKFHSRDLLFCFCFCFVFLVLTFFNFVFWREIFLQEFRENNSNKPVKPDLLNLIRSDFLKVVFLVDLALSFKKN